MNKKEKAALKRFLRDHPYWDLDNKECEEILKILKKYGGVFIVELEAYVKGFDR